MTAIPASALTVTADTIPECDVQAHNSMVLGSLLYWPSAILISLTVTGRFFLLSFQEPDDSQELEKMRDVVLGVSDKDNDGKLSRDELAMLLSDMNES